MKTALLFAFAGLLSTAGCNSKNSDPTPATPAAQAFPDLLIAGTWTVTSYTEATQDKTSSFKGYVFVFVTPGGSTATQGSDKTPGTWAWGGNSYYGTPADSKTVVLNYGTKQPLVRISKSWLIKSASSTAIVLDSSNPAELEHLELSR